VPFRSHIASVLLLVMGLALAGAAGAELWFALKAEEVADLVRPEMTDAGLAAHRKDFETARTVFESLTTDVLPQVAALQGVPPGQFEAEIATKYPAVGQLLAQEPEIAAFAEQSLTNLERQQHNFQRADSLPGAGLPAYGSAVIDLLVAGVVIGAAVFFLRSSQPSQAAFLFIALGLACVVLIAFPLALQVPAKANSAGTVLDSLNPSEATVARTNAYLATADNAASELDQRLIPDLAGQFGLSPAQFKFLLAQQFPAASAGLDELPAILARYHTRADIRSGGASDLRTLKRLPVAALGWFEPAFGVVLAVATGFAWYARQRSGEEGQAPAS
jgi:hypothetical protein